MATGVGLAQIYISEHKFHLHR